MHAGKKCTRDGVTATNKLMRKQDIKKSSSVDTTGSSITDNFSLSNYAAICTNGIAVFSKKLRLSIAHHNIANRR